MAKGWFPSIDMQVCENCGDCIDFCTHGVFGAGVDHPTVINPDRCVEFCRGCSKICPNEAIHYFGDERTLAKKEV